MTKKHNPAIIVVKPEKQVRGNDRPPSKPKETTKK